MGVTIEEHVGVIEDLKSTLSVCMSEPEKTEICTSLSVAMDIMRKHQKLEAYMRKLEKSAQYGTLRKLKIALGEIEDE